MAVLAVEAISLGGGEVRMNYRELYNTLSQAELKSVAVRARLTLEDVRQEALLKCWQIAQGASDYDPDRGTVRQYLMAKLWGLAARQTEVRTVAWGGSERNPVALPAAICSADSVTPSVLDALIMSEEGSERTEEGGGTKRVINAKYAGLSSTAILLDQGISSSLIAALTGVTPQAVRQRVSREHARRARLNARNV